MFDLIFSRPVRRIRSAANGAVRFTRAGERIFGSRCDRDRRIWAEHGEGGYLRPAFCTMYPQRAS